MKTNILYIIALLLLQACLSDEGIKVEKKDGSSVVQFGKRLSMTGATSVTQSSCSPVAINVLSLDNQSLNVADDLSIDLSIIGSGSLYSDSGCTTAINSTTIFTGTSLTSLYFMSSAVGSSIIRGTATGFGNAELSVNVVSPGTVITPAATKLKVSGAQSFQKSMCVPLNVTLLDQNNNAFETATARAINLSGVSSVFSDSSCSISASSITLAIGESQKLFYLNVSVVGGHVLTAASAGLLSDNFPLVVLDIVTTPTVTESNLQLSGPTQFNSGLCVPFNVNLLGSNGLLINATASKPITISGVPAGQLYSDSGCSSSLVSLSVAAGSSSTTFYLRMPAAGSAVLTGASAGLVSSSLSVLATEASTSTPPALSKIKISGAQSLQKDLCAPLNLSLLDQFNNSIVAPGATTVNLTGVTSIYSDSSCSTTAGTISFSTGESNKLFYVKVAAAGGYVLSGTSTGLTGDTFPLVVLDTSSSSGPVSESNLDITGPQQFVVNSCVPFSVNLLGSNGLPMAATSDKTITLGGMLLGNLFSENTCTSSLSSLSDLEILTGASSTSFYLRIPAPGSAVLAVSSLGLTGDNIAVLATSTSSSPVAQALAVQGVYSAGMNDCVPMSATVLNSNNVPMLVTGTTTVNFSTSNSNLEVYSDPICSSLASNLNLLTGEGILNFYVKGALSGNYMITLASPGLSSANHALNISSAPTTPTPYKLYLSTVSQAVQDVCTPITVTSQDASSNAITVPANVTVSVSDIGDVDFFSDSSCSVAATSATILSGSSTSIFYFKANTGLSAILMASASGLADGQFNLSILPPSGATGSPVQLRILGASGTYNELCGSYLIQSVDENNILRNVTSSKTITLSGVGTGSFYSDSACTSVITTTTIPNGSSSVGVYYRNNTVENILMLATTSGLTQGTLSVVISSNPEALGGLKIEGQGSILTSACTPYSFSAIKNNGGLKTLTSNLSFSLNSIAGVSWFTNSSCTTPLVSPQIANGSSNVVYYMRATAPGSYLVQATSGALNPGVIGVSVGASGTDIGINFENSDFVISESHGSVTLKVLLTSPAIGNITIPYTVSGTGTRPADHNLANGNIVIASGQTQGLISFVVYDDPLPESNETIIVTLGSAPSGYYLGTKGSVTITVQDNDSGNTSIALVPDIYQKMVTGQQHTCGLTQGGGVKCWGYNQYGRLGDGTGTNSNVPVQVVGLSSNVIDIAAGTDFSCALLSSGEAKCWGYNNYGQLGNGNNTFSSVPVEVLSSSGFTSIAAGSVGACGITVLKGVKCWGRAPMGGNFNVPNDVADLGGAVTAVTLGSDHICVLMEDLGKVKCWGSNGQYQLGLGSSTPSYSMTPLEVSNLSSVKFISAGLYHTCAAIITGGVKCWGRGDSYQAGDGSTAVNSTPKNPTGLTSDTIVSLGSSENSSCVVLATGEAKCWGDNSYGQLGDGTASAGTIPTSVSSLSQKATLVSQGSGRHICFGLKDGSSSCTGGYGSFGQLGNGNNATSYSHVPVSILGTSVSLSHKFLPKLNWIEAIGNRTCAQSEFGLIYCWGYNNNTYDLLRFGTLNNSRFMMRGKIGTIRHITNGDASSSSHSCFVTETGAAMCLGHGTTGQLGQGAAISSSTPVQVNGLTSGVAKVAVSKTSGYFSCALTTSGGAKCWGYNNVGQLGDTTLTQRISPVDVSGLTSGVLDVQAGANHACALTASGGVKCWGQGTNGELGNGLSTTSSTPVDVTGLTSGVSKIGVGDNHACAVLTGGSVKCWGHGSAGKLGNGLTTNQPSPVDVTGIATAVGVSAGQHFSCAVLVSGGVKCWGQGNSGQLGNGLTANQTTPVDVTGVTNALQVSTGSSHACAVLASGGAKCWGFNSNGQLSDGTVTQRTSPVDVLYPFSVMDYMPKIYTGEKHTCSTYLNKLYCWGDNSYGQLGTGDTVSANTAVLASMTLPLSKVSLGEDHTCVLTKDQDALCFGRNHRGQLGNKTTIDNDEPQFAMSEVDEMASGSYFNCARSGNLLKCWGANDFGQIGDGTYVDKSSPTTVPLAVNEKVFAGTSSVCANTVVRTYCWGDNSYNQLGLGSGAGASFSIPQNTSSLFNELAIGKKHSCGIRGTTIHCAGQNSYGQLGNIIGQEQSSFALVSGVPPELKRPDIIGVGDDHSCVRNLDLGKIYCWGSNYYGQLGQDRLAYSSIPAHVPGATNIFNMSIGSKQACFIRSISGTQNAMAPQCFGYGQEGQLGNGSNSNSPVPVFVQGAP